jgi:hypothetical protein
MTQKKTKDLERLEKLQMLIKDKKPTRENHIEGVGTVVEYGRLDSRSFVKRLLQSKYITG